MSHHDTLTQALEQIAMAAEATVCNPAWIAQHARAALAKAQAPQAHALDRGAIIDLISPLSRNTADHDIDFAFRVLDAAQAQQSIDAEALIRAVLPGGSSCDPQTVADEIRRYLGQWPGQASTFAEYMGCDTAQAQQAGEPVAWRWRNCVGDWVTGWLDYKPSQRACIEQQVTEAGGIIQYAYTTPPAHAQPVQGVPDGWEIREDDTWIYFKRPDGFCQAVTPNDPHTSHAQTLHMLMRAMLTASPTPPAQQKGGEA